jgi:integrase
MILLPQAKNGEYRMVHLNKDAVAAVASLLDGSEHRPTEKLFQDITGDRVSVAFYRACYKTGIEDFRFRALRRTAARWFRMKGTDIHTVAQLLGYKDPGMAIRYQHLSGQFLSDAVRRLEGVLRDLRYKNRYGPLNCWRPLVDDFRNWVMQAA